MSAAGDIKTFVVLDLETNGLPSQQFNTCAITELSVYAFSAKCLTDKDIVDTKDALKDVTPEEGVEGFDLQPPELPRVLNKLTLMINPGRMINPTAERVTGLSNEMLEHESPFDIRTAECFNLFLERLEKPICMVAHNGWTFDYPVIRYVYDKINKSLPASIFCVDSFKAFRELDEKHDKIKETKKVLSILEAEAKEIVENELAVNEDVEEVTNTITSDPLEENSQINWQHDNETTPQRKKKTEKRDFSTLTNDDDDNLTDSREDTTYSPAKKRSVSLCVRRSLFADNFKPKTKYPPKGVYQLGNIYKRCFNKDPINLHRAESDVEILSKLILHYGLDFLAYAEERKQLFSQVPKLGSPN